MKPDSLCKSTVGKPGYSHNFSGVANLGNIDGTAPGSTNLGSNGVLVDDGSVTAGFDYPYFPVQGVINNQGGSVTIGASGTMNLVYNGLYEQSAGTTSVAGTLSATELDVEGGTFNSDNDTGVTNLGNQSYSITGINLGTNGTLIDNGTVNVYEIENDGGTVTIGSAGTMNAQLTYTQLAGSTNVEGNINSQEVDVSAGTFTDTTGEIDLGLPLNTSSPGCCGLIALTSNGELADTGTITATEIVNDGGSVFIGGGNMTAGTLNVVGTYGQYAGTTDVIDGTLNAGSLLVVGGTYTLGAGITNLGGISGTIPGSINIGSGGFADASGGTIDADTLIVQGSGLYGTGVSSTTNLGTISGTAPGSINLATNGAISDNGTIDAVVINNDGGSVTIGGAGMLNLQSGPYTQTAGSTTVGGTLYVVGEYLQNGGTTGVEGTLTAASLDVEGGTYTNDTGVTNLGNATSSVAGSVNVGSNSTLTDNAIIYVGQTSGSTGTVNNVGTVSIGETGTLLVLGSGGNYTQSAGLTDVNGTLISPSISITGGTLEGAGFINGSVSQTGGTFEPGGDPGILTVTGSDSISNLIYAEEIGGTTAGTDYSVLDVGTSFSILNTPLSLDWLNSFIPTDGEIFDIINAGSISGEFSNNDISFAGGTFSVSYLAGGCADDDSACVDLTWEQASVGQVPEPSSLVLFGIGLLALGWAASRRGSSAIRSSGSRNSA